MNRPLFYSLIGIGLGAMAAFLFFMVWYSSTPSQQLASAKVAVLATDVTPTSSLNTFTSITIKDLTLKELEKNKDVEIIINAQECKFLQPSDIVECAHVTCTLLNHKEPSALIKTQKALINRTEKKIFFSGNVLGTIKDVIIQGTDINYNFSQQVLYTEKTTIYHHPDFNINAQKSFIDLKNNRIELFDGVTNEFIMHEK